MRHNNMKFIEPLAMATADALTVPQEHEIARKESDTRRPLGRGCAWMATAFAVLLGSVVSAFADHHGGQAWALSDESRISLTSTKNGLVSETHSLSAIKGGVSAGGKVELELDLRAIETNIPIRNERMQTWLFSDEPVARLSANVQHALSAKETAFTIDQTLTIEANGNTVMLDVPMTVAREGDAVAKVAGQLVIDVADFDYAPGIEKLREIAGLKSISTEVPVDVKLVFVREPPRY